MKQIIINTFLELKKQYCNNASRSFSSKKNKYLRDELLKLTAFLDKTDPLSKRVYCLMHNITEIQQCKCGVVLKSWTWGGGFQKECPKCSMKNPERMNKIKNTCLERYGVTTNLQTDEVTKLRLKSQKSEKYSETLKEMWKNKTEEEIKLRKKKIENTCLKKYGSKNVFSKDSTLFDIVQENNKIAIMEKYGVENIAKVPEIYMRGRMTRIKLGYERHPDQKEDVENYYIQVWKYTNQSFKEHYYEITENETIKRGKDNHLDHIYSIHYGFINNILPSIIGHRNNLRLIPSSENVSKNKRCDITIEEIIQYM